MKLKEIIELVDKVFPGSEIIEITEPPSPIQTKRKYNKNNQNKDKNQTDLF